MTPIAKTTAILVSVSLALTATARAYETAITDTTGYTVLSASDTGSQSSIANGTHFGGSLSSTTDYLVNNALDIRTPSTANANTTFGGHSLTLDGGARVILKGKSSKTTISDFRLYNSRLHHGEASSGVTIAGGMTVHATVANPVLVQGAGGRSLSLESSISGASGTRIKVESSGDAHAGSNPFFLHLKGSNSGYAGSFEVAGERFALVGYNNNSFGSAPAIALSNGGRMFSGGESTVVLSSPAIILTGGGTMGVYTKTGSNVGLQINGGTISGTGTLTIDNTGTEGDHLRRVALGAASISGIDGIVVNSGLLQLNEGFNNPAVPITVTQPVMLRTLNGIQAGPVTLQAGSNTDSSDGSITLASLTLETTAAGTPFIRKYLHKGLVTITGDIANNLASGEKIRIDFTVTAISQLANTNSFRVLSAANLGATGVTAADFVATADNTDESLRGIVTNGAFSIEESGGTKYLVYTLNKKAVYSTATDGYSDHSFTAGGHWSDGKVPHDDADYFVMNGHQIRSVRGGSSTFSGHSLSVLSGGKVAVQGQTGTATVSDLRLFGGGILTTTTHYGNNLAGGVTVCGSSSTPAIYEAEWASGSPEASGRWLTIQAPISGSGALLCRYQNQAATTLGAPVAGLNLRGDNRNFTGEWQIMHPAAKATFTSASNVGSASAIVLNSNGVFQAQGDIDLPAATAVVVMNVGSVAGNEDLTNGGTIEVDASQTLTVNGVVSGAGILRKSGAGTLLLHAENTLIGTLAVNEGLIGGAGKVQSATLADGAGFAVDATQAEPFEIGTLTLDGGISLAITGLADANLERIAIAKVGTLVGTLPASPAAATIDGRSKHELHLSFTGGVLYATRSPFVLVVR